MDWMHDQLFDGRRIWVLTMVDTWSRVCPALRVCRAANAAEVTAALDEAVRGKDQKRAATVAARYGKLGHEAAPLIAVLRKHSIGDDGAAGTSGVPSRTPTTQSEHAAGRAAQRSQSMSTGNLPWRAPGGPGSRGAR